MDVLHKLDGLDVKILKKLERDARANVVEMSKELKMPQSTIYLRIKRLEKRGVIKGYRAVIDRDLMGKSVKVLIDLKVRTTSDANELLKQFDTTEDVMALYSTTGDSDGVIILQGKDMDDIDSKLLKIRHVSGVVNTSTRVVLNTLKEDFTVVR